MKLKEGLIFHAVGEEHMAVATGEAAKSFNGIIRNNETAAYIFELLQKDTTQEKVVAAMCERYDAPESVIAADVDTIIKEIRKAGLLDE